MGFYDEMRFITYLMRILLCYMLEMFTRERLGRACMLATEMGTTAHRLPHACIEAVNLGKEKLHIFLSIIV